MSRYNIKPQAMTDKEFVQSIYEDKILYEVVDH